MRQQHTVEHRDPSTFATDGVLDRANVENAAGIEQDHEEARTETAGHIIAELGNAVQIRKRAIKWIPLPVLTVATSLIAVSVLLSHGVIGIRPVYSTLLAAFLAGNVGLVALLFCGTARLNRGSRANAGTDDLMAVGVLAESLSAGEPALSIAGSVLIRLLPKITREQMEMLTPAQRIALRKGLQSASTRRRYTQYNPVLAVAILQALERFGDKSDLAAVEGLASNKANTPDQILIQAAAAKCLSSITTRSISDSGTRVVWMEAKHSSDSNTSLSTGAVEALSTRLRNIARLRRRNVAITATGAVVGTGLALLSLFGFAAGHQVDSVLAAGMLGSLAVMVGFALSGTYEQRNLTNALIHSDDLRIIPPLIQASATVEISGTAAVMLLTRLLPRLRASDASILNTVDRTLLHTAMVKHARNTEFVLAAITALQQIGDATSIPIVQRLVERTGRNTSDPRIREAARECLQFLQQRAAMTEANHTLLRASSGSAAPTDTLLRAIDGTVPTASKELLRTSLELIVYEQQAPEIEQQNVQAFAFQPAG